MEYIPSRFTYSQVLEILDLEKKRSTRNLKNYRYFMLLLWKIMSFFLVVALAIFVFEHGVRNHTTYLFPWVKVMEYFSGFNVLIQTFLTSLWYFIFWIILLLLLYKLFLVPVAMQMERYLIKRNLVIPDRFEGDRVEIRRVYENIDEFIHYIRENPGLTENDFSVDRTGQFLTRTIHYMDGDEKVEFYFGSSLKKIILEHRILDFSKCDLYYGLLDEQNRQKAKENKSVT